MPIQFEYFEKDRPSYLPAYLMSFFVLMGLHMILDMPIWPLRLAHLVLAVWFGVLFIWILRYAKQESYLTSNRLTLDTNYVRQSFRYALKEEPFIEILANDLKRIEIHVGNPICLWFFGGGETILHSFSKYSDHVKLVSDLALLYPDTPIEIKDC